ncbi:adenosylmethionine--8-amino-7-oxononanoate transaminase [Campylobacter sp. 2018MI01]|uniref:adenosylmethionine--8-amino-7-oxononanoate transaminase n=1 Tax=Campylobacter sp. 2018MI01 TaxID=2836735 RepID=UPI001BD9CA02|nr:adenosylmethionine--8-amino-7-oxononanoate transaminase [Campylobacter sp. 2018MI01]MBT0878249.1 adenosylmethionine--8-amino-7-oxononanoate transaminase [Campylobacter sp. 2018MI01]
MQEELVKLDLAHIWHPCTQMKEHEFVPLIPIKRAKGVYLYDFNDKSYIDCVSSWWVNLFGHSNDYINSKIHEQLNTLEHIIMAGFSHESIIRLSKRLTDLLPTKLNKCFYADNGSSAVEVALKMSFHKNLLQGKLKSKFLSLSNSYHGETIAALSVSDVELYKKTYKPLLLECLNTPAPSGLDYENELKELEKLLEKEHKNINAFILEPLIQCAGSMNMYSAKFIKKACWLAKSYDIDIIFDEIAVGFGRSGTMFALEQCEIVPDFLCLSKGLSGGYLPISVVITNDEIYNEFYAPYSEYKAFLHSHSYTGNALACAAANATLDIFTKDNVINQNKIKSEYINSLWQGFAEFKSVRNVRHQGMVFAFDIEHFNPRFGLEVYLKALEYGLLLRPLGNTIYFMPPYVINNDEINYVINSIKEILRFKNLK